MTRLLTTLLIVLVVLPTYGSPEPAGAQNNADDPLQYDFNNDDNVRCDDFIEQYPTTYTDEATAALNLFPEELTELDDDDGEDDGIACEGQPGGTNPEPDPDPGAVAPVPSDLPSDPAPVATAPDATGCDVIVENGRAFVHTDCADGTVEVGFVPFEGFDAFAERAQNGFGAFDDTASESTTGCIEVAHASACAGGEVRVGLDVDADESDPLATSDDISTGAAFPVAQRTTDQGSRLVESEQHAKKAKQKRKKAKKAKRIKARQLQRERLRQQADDRD